MADCGERLEAQGIEAREKLANWEPWMSALGRMLAEHRIARFPDDVLAWREKLGEVEKVRQMVDVDSKTHKGGRRAIAVQVAVALGHILQRGDYMARIPRKDIDREDEELRLAREDFSPEAWEQTLQELEQAKEDYRLAEIVDTGRREALVKAEDRNAVLAAALREFGHHDQDCEGHRQKFDDLEHCHCGLSLALSDTQTGTAGGGWRPLPTATASGFLHDANPGDLTPPGLNGWLPPEVREQARAALQAWFDWENDGTGQADTTDYDEEGAETLQLLMVDTRAALAALEVT